jgi:hypothetical protein
MEAIQRRPACTQANTTMLNNTNQLSKTSGPTCVADPDVFWPPESGFFYHHAKIVRKTLISTVLWLLYDFLYVKNYVNVPSKSKKKNLGKNRVSALI